MFVNGCVFTHIPKGNSVYELLSILGQKVGQRCLRCRSFSKKSKKTKREKIPQIINSQLKCKMQQQYKIHSYLVVITTKTTIMPQNRQQNKQITELILT